MARKNVRYTAHYRPRQTSPEEIKELETTKFPNLGSNLNALIKALMNWNILSFAGNSIYHQRMVQPAWNYKNSVNQPSFSKRTHPSAQKTMVPRAVLMKSGLKPLNTAKQVNTDQIKSTMNAARLMTYFFKVAHSFDKRPINKLTIFNNSNFNQQVNIVRGKVNIVRSTSVINTNSTNRVSATSSKVTTARPNGVVPNVIQVSNGLGPQKKPIFLSDVQGNPQTDLQDKGVIDSGCSRHMTGNISYLTNFDEIDGGYVAFRGNPKGGKISRRGTIRTGKLDFENVYFVLLRVPRNNNMYSIDLKNIVPKGGLTFLIEKATIDESKLWHRRLGTKASVNTGQARMETKPVKDYILLPLWTADPPIDSTLKSSDDAGFKPSSDDGKKGDDDPGKDSKSNDQEDDDNINNTNNVNTVSSSVNAAGTNKEQH
ncbi:hypothetical protein Tco_0670833 [Tanacetum coccineum]